MEEKLKSTGKGCLVYIQPINILLHQSGKK